MEKIGKGKGKEVEKKQESTFPTQKPLSPDMYTFFCTDCEKGFHPHSAFVDHMKEVHERKKTDPVICGFKLKNCDPSKTCKIEERSFRYGNLETHIRTRSHANERVYYCVDCRKDWSDKSQANKAHKNIKPTHVIRENWDLVCSTRPPGFTRRQKLLLEKEKERAAQELRVQSPLQFESNSQSQGQSQMFQLAGAQGPSIPNSIPTSISEETPQRRRDHNSDIIYHSPIPETGTISSIPPITNTNSEALIMDPPFAYNAVIDQANHSYPPVHYDQENDEVAKILLQMQEETLLYQVDSVGDSVTTMGLSEPSNSTQYQYPYPRASNPETSNWFLDGQTVVDSISDWRQNCIGLQNPQPPIPLHPNPCPDSEIGSSTLASTSTSTVASIVTFQTSTSASTPTSGQNNEDIYELKNTLKPMWISISDYYASQGIDPSPTIPMIYRNIIVLGEFESGN